MERRVVAGFDRDVVDEAPWIPLLVLRTLELISSRVGNYVYSIWVAGALLDQLWVR